MAVALAVVEVAFDWGTWIELNVAVLYSLPLVLAAFTRRRALVWALAFALIGMTFAVYMAQVSLAMASSPESYLIDRMLSAVSILLSAGILHAWLRSMHIRDVQGRAIEQQNARLEATNVDLRAHKDEILRKNEELERRRCDIEGISNRKTQMLASISHDIRSPLQAITLMAEVIERAARIPEQVKGIPALAKRLQANAVSITDFLSEVIDLASFENGQNTVTNSQFGLRELIDLQCERMLPMAESKGLNLVTSACDLRLHTDRLKLARIIGNLVGNAIKFTHKGTVTVDCGLNGEESVFIRVRDTGPGIKPDDLNRIFKEFAQVDRSPRVLENGWGLGLAISRRMIRMLGGDIEVESKLGVGSVFIVNLPPSSLVAG